MTNYYFCLNRPAFFKRIRFFKGILIVGTHFLPGHKTFTRILYWMRNIFDKKNKSMGVPGRKNQLDYDLSKII